MTEEPLPPEEAAVRRLLGSVGDAPSMPPEVADRLDTVLAGLAAERVDHDPERIAPVVALSSRRRKALAALFVAAAAVVVAGIGIPLVHDSATTDRTASSDSTLTRPTTPSAGTADAGAAGQVQGYAAREASPRSTRQPHGAATSLHASLDALDKNTNLALADRPLRATLLKLRSGLPADASYSGTRVHAPAGFTCTHARFGRGYLLGIRYAGAPAVVAFRAPTGSTQVAEVLQCGTAQVLRSLTLPIP